MIIKGYPKLNNIKQTAEETKQALGVPTKATYTAAILGLISVPAFRKSSLLFFKY